MPAACARKRRLGSLLRPGAQALVRQRQGNIAQSRPRRGLRQGQIDHRPLRLAATHFHRSSAPAAGVPPPRAWALVVEGDKRLDQRQANVAIKRGRFAGTRGGLVSPPADAARPPIAPARSSVAMAA